MLLFASFSNTEQHGYTQEERCRKKKTKAEMSCLFVQPRMKCTLIQKQPSLKRNDTRTKTWRNISVLNGGQNWNRSTFISSFRCKSIVISVDITALLFVIKPQ